VIAPTAEAPLSVLERESSHDAMRVAVVDDDETQLAAVAGLIETSGHCCRQFSNGEQLLSTLQLEDFDLFVIGQAITKERGLEIVARLRHEKQNRAQILLFGRGTSARDVIRSLNAGADVYVEKPTDRQILTAKIESLLRRVKFNRQTDRHARFGNYIFDKWTKRLAVDGKQIEVTTKEFDLAFLLFQNLHRALPRAYILENAWGRNPDLSTRTLDTHVSRIRVKLNLRPEGGFRLAPVYGFGYRLERLDPSRMHTPNAGA
jgi:DNA-binding response OmpR family regulator